MTSDPLKDPAWHQAESRRKAERDWATRLQSAWLKGYRQGLGDASEERELLAHPEVVRRLQARGLDAETVIRWYPRDEPGLDRQVPKVAAAPVQDLPEELAQEEGIAQALASMREALASDAVRELLEMRRKVQREEATLLEAEESKGREEARRDRAAAAL